MYLFIFGKTASFTKFLPELRERISEIFTLHSAKIMHNNGNLLTVWKLRTHRKNISSNHLFSNFYSKTITFTKILPKKV